MCAVFFKLQNINPQYSTKRCNSSDPDIRSWSHAVCWMSCFHILRICKYLLQRDLWKTVRVALCFFSEATEFRIAECPDHATKVHKKRWHHQKHERIRLNNRLRHHIRHPCCARKNGFYKYINSYANKLRGDWAECPRITVAFSPVYLRSWASQLLLPYYDSSLFRTLQ